MSAIRTVQAVQWACPDCHDTGLEHTEAEASAALDEHAEDYHSSIDDLDLDDLDDAEEQITFDDGYRLT